MESAVADQAQGPPEGPNLKRALRLGVHIGHCGTSNVKLKALTARALALWLLVLLPAHVPGAACSIQTPAKTARVSTPT